MPEKNTPAPSWRERAVAAETRLAAIESLYRLWCARTVIAVSDDAEMILADLSRTLGHDDISLEAGPAAAVEEQPHCTCPSGDGSLRWPCPAHPPGHDHTPGHRPADGCATCGLPGDRWLAEPACAAGETRREAWTQTIAAYIADTEDPGDLPKIRGLVEELMNSDEAPEGGHC